MPTCVTFKEKVRFKRGYMKLYGGRKKPYHNLALYVPNYGWVPCSQKLTHNFTDQSEKLMLVITNEDDLYKPITSDIWITLSNVVMTIEY